MKSAQLQLLQQLGRRRVDGGQDIRSSIVVMRCLVILFCFISTMIVDITRAYIFKSYIWNGSTYFELRLTRKGARAYETNALCNNYNCGSGERFKHCILC